MRKLLALAVLFTVVLLNNNASSEQLRVSTNLRHEQVYVPAATPDRDRMVIVDHYLFFDDDAFGVFVYYDDPRTSADVDYIEFYDIDGSLLVVTWIDRFGLCHVAMDRGLLDPDDPFVDGTLVLVGVGQLV
jgi:hypothetical protein